jgi:threonine dehydratase
MMKKLLGNLLDTFALTNITSDSTVSQNIDCCRAVQTLYSIGLVVEPSGAAGVAAVLAGHIDMSGKSVVIVVTGGNVSPKELDKWIPENIEK